MKILGSSRLALVVLFSAFALTSTACKKKKTSDPTPTPSPSATATPSPSPSPSASPTAQDMNIPGCIGNPIPDRAVSVIPSGGCAAGFRSVEWSDGTRVCIANSACRVPGRENFRCWRGDYPEIGWDCHPQPESVEFEVRNSHGIILDKNTGLFYDEGRGYSDAYGRVFMNPNGPPTHDWYWGGGCPPRVCITKPAQRCFPTPPTLARFDLEVQGMDEGGRWIIDATPIVCNGPPGSPTANYCETHSNGAVNGCCPVRKASDSMRETCELDLIGKNPYTKKYELQVDGHYYRTNNPFQFLLLHKQGGLTVCSNPYPSVGGPNMVCSDLEAPE